MLWPVLQFTTAPLAGRGTAGLSGTSAAWAATATNRHTNPIDFNISFSPFSRIGTRYGRIRKTDVVALLRAEILTHNPSPRTTKPDQ
jgi:hypothetical protein